MLAGIYSNVGIVPVLFRSGSPWQGPELFLFLASVQNGSIKPYLRLGDTHEIENIRYPCITWSADRSVIWGYFGPRNDRLWCVDPWRILESNNLHIL